MLLFDAEYGGVLRGYFPLSIVALPLSGQTGLTNSVRQMGQPSQAGPSDFTKAGELPLRIQTCMSGGCFPTNGATAPRTPPISTLTTYRVALRRAPPVANQSSPSALIASFTSSGLGVATTMDAAADCAPAARFRRTTGTIPFARFGGSSRRASATFS